MNRTTSLVLVAALVGAGAGTALTGYLAQQRQRSAEAAKDARIATLELRIAELQKNLSDARRVEVPSAGAGDDADPSIAAGGDNASESATGSGAPPIASLEDLIKEARPFLKRMSPLFDQFRRQAQGEWIDTQIARWQESLGLTEEQANAIRASLTATADEMAAERIAKLEDESVPLDQALGGAEFWASQMKAMDEIMEQNLSDEQFLEYETEQLTQRAEMITNQANRDLDRMTTALELDEVQQDEVFGILVRTSPTYDPAMQIEGGLASEFPEIGQSPTEPLPDRNEAIRTVLRPEQMENYDAYLQRRQTPWAGGAFGGSFGGR